MQAEQLEVVEQHPAVAVHDALGHAGGARGEQHPQRRVEADPLESWARVAVASRQWRRAQPVGCPAAHRVPQPDVVDVTVCAQGRQRRAQRGDLGRGGRGRVRSSGSRRRRRARPARAARSGRRRPGLRSPARRPTRPHRCWRRRGTRRGRGRRWAGSRRRGPRADVRARAATRRTRRPRRAARPRSSSWWCRPRSTAITAGPSSSPCAGRARRSSAATPGNQRAPGIASSARTRPRSPVGEDVEEVPDRGPELLEVLDRPSPQLGVGLDVGAVALGDELREAGDRARRARPARSGSRSGRAVRLPLDPTGDRRHV